MIDLHCHILPGIDDGPATMKDALSMCRQMVADGTVVAVATPHQLTDRYAVSKSDILRGVHLLRAELDDAGIPLDVRAGADVMITSDLTRLLRDGAVMTVGDGGTHVLLELPHDVLPRGLDELLCSVQMLGITPIISHPERQFEFQRRPDLLRPLIGRGHLVQVTASSIEGAFGGAAQKSVLALLKSRMVHLCASDAHSPRGRRPGLSRARKIVERLLTHEEARRIFDVNPARVLQGAPIEPFDAHGEPAPSPKAGRFPFFWRK